MPKKQPPTPPSPAPRQKERARRETRKPKGGSPNAARTEARRDALHQAIRQHGLSNLDVKHFAKQVGVAQKTIYEDLKILCGEVGQRGADVIVLAALENLRRANVEYLAILAEARRTRRGPDGTEVACITDGVRLGAAKALAEATKAEIDALQRLGLLKTSEPAGTEEAPFVIKMWQPTEADAREDDA